MCFDVREERHSGCSNDKVLGNKPLLKETLLVTVYIKRLV